MLQLGPCRSEWPKLLPNVMVTSGAELQLRAMSGSMALLQPVSVLMSTASDTIKGHADVRDLDCHLGPCWYPRAMLIWVVCIATWDYGDI